MKYDQSIVPFLMGQIKKLGVAAINKTPENRTEVAFIIETITEGVTQLIDLANPTVIIVDVKRERHNLNGEYF